MMYFISYKSNMQTAMAYFFVWWRCTIITKLFCSFHGMASLNCQFQGCSLLFEKWGAHLYWPPSPLKKWMTQSTFFLKLTQKVVSPFPSAPSMTTSLNLTKSCQAELSKHVFKQDQNYSYLNDKENTKFVFYKRHLRSTIKFVEN